MAHRRVVRFTATVVGLFVALIATGCSLPPYRSWEIPTSRTIQDFERDHRVCYADAHQVTLGFFSPAEIDRAYVECLEALGWKPAAPGATSPCSSRYSRPRPYCQPSTK